MKGCQEILAMGECWIRTVRRSLDARSQTKTVVGRTSVRVARRVPEASRVRDAVPEAAAVEVEEVEGEGVDVGGQVICVAAM